MTVSPPVLDDGVTPLDQMKHGPRLAMLVAIWLAVVLLAGWQAGAWTQRAALSDLRVAMRSQLDLYANGIRAEIAKFRSVPSVLARSPKLLDALRRPAAADALSREFAAIAREVGAANLYLLDAAGTAVAASNWEQPDSLVGRNFAFRPYFAAAIAGRPGEFFALGTSTNRPGYYLSLPVHDGAAVAGVVAIKVSFDALEVGWGTAPEHIVVSNADDVVIATNVLGWRFRTLAPLSHEARERIRDTMQFTGADLTPLPIRAHWSSAEGGFAVLPGSPGREGGGTATFLVEALPVPETGWTVRGFASTDAIWIQTVRAAASGAVLAGVAAWLALWGLGRAQRLRLRLVQESAGRDELERRVRERTAALESANRTLRQEVRERQRAEAELREAQGDLLQAAKLAALGQMSASLAHELDRPLAEIRSFAEGAADLLQHDRIDDARGNLRQIAALTERMAAVAQHLNSFARRPNGEIGRVDLRPVLDEAIGLLGPKLRHGRIKLMQHLPPEPLLVRAEQGRLGQVLVDLIQNACDAVEGVERREVTVAVEIDGERVRLAVADSGSGFAPYQLPHLFQNFFTTKAPGLGLGLGLAVSRDIVESFGGRITAGNGAGGGAVVTVELPRAQSPDVLAGLDAGMAGGGA